MEATLFKQVGYSLSKLIEDIDIGEIGLPDIQRTFVWTTAKVRDLFDSMYKGFPVGYLLFWINALNGNHRQIGIDIKQKAPRLLIVDGQQRLTALYAVLKGRNIIRSDYTEQSIQIAFRPCDARFDVADAAIRRDPEFIHNISELWSGEHARNRFVKDFIKKLREYRPVSEQEEDMLNESIDKLYDLQHYPFTALELSPNIDEERVAEPDQLLRVCVGLGFRRARSNYVYSILRGKDLETEQFSEERRIRQFEVLKDSQARVLDLQNWHEFLKVLIRAGFRSASMISSQAALLYSYVMFLIGKYDFKMDLYELRNLVVRWFFMTTLTARYSASPETTMEADLARFNPDELKGMYYWHALSDGWENMTYEDFLKARRKAIAQIIREGYRRLSGGLEY